MTFTPINCLRTSCETLRSGLALWCANHRHASRRKRSSNSWQMRKLCESYGWDFRIDLGSFTEAKAISAHVSTSATRWTVGSTSHQQVINKSSTSHLCNSVIFCVYPTECSFTTQKQVPGFQGSTLVRFWVAYFHDSWCTRPMFSCFFQMFQQIWFFIGLKTKKRQNGWNVPSLKFQCNIFGMEAGWTNKTNSSKASV